MNHPYRLAATAGLLALAGACTGQPADGRGDSAVAPSPPAQIGTAPTDVPDDTTTTTIGMRVCADSSREGEPEALRCSGARARRDGITLLVKVSGGERSFVDDTGHEAPDGYRYVGTVGDGALQVVQAWGNESYPFWIFVDQSGRSVSIPEWPVFSPDGKRFATGGSFYDNCTEANGTTLDVWRFTRSLPAREFREITQDCSAGPTGGWGALDLKWRGSDTVDFRHASLSADAAGNWTRQSRPARLVRTPTGWRMERDSLSGKR